MTNQKELTFFFIAAFAVFFGIIAGLFISLFHDLPQLNSLKQYKPPAVTTVLSRDNQRLSRFYSHRREPITIDQVPESLINGLIATEDRKFFTHSGIDIKAVFRAIIHDIAARSYVEGASTITQQLAKILFLSSEKTIFRKIKEAVITVQIERRYTKREILELYLNQVYFGSGAYGVEAAAQRFFGRHAQELTLAQSALIAGMPKAPSRYSPLVNPKLALKRRRIVLNQMLILSMISRPQYQKALKEPLNTPKDLKPDDKAPYFVNWIKNSLEQQLGDRTLATQGLTIHTTLDYQLQSAAETAASQGLALLDGRWDTSGNQEFKPECALVAIDVPSGGVISMVGGRNYRKNSYNRAVSAKRQPGSAFKPFVFARAIQQGLSQTSTILDAPLSFKTGIKTSPWEPDNYSKTFLGEITLRKALALSRNIPAIRLAKILNPSSVTVLAKQAGIVSPITTDLTMALGTSEVSLLELTSAYSLFPGSGAWTKPHGISKITDQGGHILFKARPKKIAVLSAEDAAVMTDMLRAVIMEGTGKKAAALKGEVAGKTGTTDQFKDALFIGFSADTAAGVWVGNDNGRSLGNSETGSRAALPIWIRYMEAVLKKTAYRFFDIPDHTKMIYINPDTGQRMKPGERGAVKALIKIRPDKTRNTQ